MGQEFRVNSYQDEWQEDPAILVFADGSFVIMWRSFYFPSSTYFIGGQRYAANGTPIGGEFIVDGVVGSASEVDNLALLSDGGFVVTFRFSDGGLLEPDHIYAKVYNADFTVRTASFRVDTVPSFQALNSSAAALADGGFIVFFNTDTAGPNFDDVYGQRYTAAGVPVGGNFLVNTIEADSDQSVTEVAQLAGGNVLVLWHSKATLNTGGSLFSHELRGTIINSAGVALRTDFTIADAEGSAGTGINPFALTPLSNGGFAIARYETENPSGNIFTYDVKLAFFDAFGNATGPEITAFSATLGIIYSIDVVQLTTGQVVVVWETPASPFSTYGHDIQGRIFGSDGTPLTGVFDIAQNRFDDQEDPQVAALPNGGFIVTYMSDAADASKEGIAARIFEGPFPADTGNNNVVLNGTANADTLRGYAGNDTLNGFDGNDVLVGGIGRDALNGGTGTDTASYISAAGGVYVFIGDSGSWTRDATGDTFSSIENLTGSNYNDILGMDGANNVIDGGAGDDLLFGQGGGDTLIGGAGFDTASYATATTGIYVFFGDAGAWTGDARGDTMFSIEAITGTNFNDIIGMDDFANTLAGGGGDDILYGEGGGDRLFGNAGFDTVSYAFAPSGVYILFADLGNATGDARGDSEFSSIESIIGSAFDDTIGMGDFNDTLAGGGGNDILLGNGGGDKFFGNDGFDTVSYALARSGVYVFFADLGNATGDARGDSEFSSIESIVGSNFNDIIGMGDISDTIFGGSGNDILLGMGGNDTLWGGTGNDLFAYTNTAFGNDTIRDFQDGLDRIDFSRVAGVNFASLAISAVAGGVQVGLGASSILITGTTIGQISAADFLFA